MTIYDGIDMEYVLMSIELNKNDTFHRFKYSVENWEISAHRKMEAITKEYIYFYVVYAFFSHIHFDVSKSTIFSELFARAMHVDVTNWFDIFFLFISVSILGVLLRPSKCTV